MKYDLAIIGGGPAGMMAAGRAGELGSRVVLLEKNNKLGVKLLATGGGRCNITNLKDARGLANSFGNNGRWLLSAFSKFGPEELIEFFASRGLKTKVEEEGRVFPKSDSAADVQQVLAEYLKSLKIEVKLGAEVKKVVGAGDKISKLILVSGQEIIADKYLICTGGKSYPQTGSTGDGYQWLKQLGHKIISPRPALAPVIIKDKFIKDLEGLSFKETGISYYSDNKKVDMTVGPLIFTANSLSGPAILNMSAIVGRENLKGAQIKIDFFPNLDFSKLDQELSKDFSSSNKALKNGLDQLIPPRLASVLINLAGFDGRKKLNLISREERQTLTRLLKEFPLTVLGLAGYDRAMVTAGGVDLKEINPKNMRSKIIENLYLAGEVLNLNGPTGGYNLQLCWTSGYLAGDSAAK